MGYATHMSDRQKPLVCIDIIEDGKPPIISVENYTKWYSIFLVRPRGIVEKIPYDGTITWHSHVPNPSDVQAYAERHGYEIDFQSMEMMIGRYMLEVQNIEPEYIGQEYGSAPERATEPTHFCDGSCVPGVGSYDHVMVTPEMQAAANDLSDEYRKTPMFAMALMRRKAIAA